MLFQFFLVQGGEAGDDDNIALFRQMSSGSIDANSPGAFFCVEGIGLKPVSVGDVPNVNMLVRKDVGGLEQVFIDGDASFIMKVCVGHHGSVDLGFKDGS